MLNDRYVNWGRNLKHKFKIVEPKSLNDLKIFKKEKIYFSWKWKIFWRSSFK